MRLYQNDLSILTLITRVSVKETIAFTKTIIKGFSWVDWTGLGEEFICIAEWYFIEGAENGSEKDGCLLESLI